MKTEKWKDWEEAILRMMLFDGKSDQEIANVLGRTKLAVYNKKKLWNMWKNPAWKKWKKY